MAKQKKQSKTAWYLLTAIGSVTFIIVFITGLVLWFSVNTGTEVSNLSNIDCSTCSQTQAFLAHQQHQKQLAGRVLYGTFVVSSLILLLTYAAHKKTSKINGLN